MNFNWAYRKTAESSHIKMSLKNNFKLTFNDRLKVIRLNDLPFGG